MVLHNLLLQSSLLSYLNFSAVGLVAPSPFSLTKRSDLGGFNIFDDIHPVGEEPGMHWDDYNNAKDEPPDEPPESDDGGNAQPDGIGNGLDENVYTLAGKTTGMHSWISEICGS